MIQDEIREGLERIVFSKTGAETILQFLHSKGVVIKKEGELPEYDGFASETAGAWEMSEIMIKAGYTLTEPLIKEE